MSQALLSPACGAGALQPGAQTDELCQVTTKGYLGHQKISKLCQLRQLVLDTQYLKVNHVPELVSNFKLVSLGQVQLLARLLSECKFVALEFSRLAFV